jgi:hypothetical protein
VKQAAEQNDDTVANVMKALTDFGIQPEFHVIRSRFIHIKPRVHGLGRPPFSSHQNKSYKRSHRQEQIDWFSLSTAIAGFDIKFAGFQETIIPVVAMPARPFLPYIAADHAASRRR